MNDEDEGAKEVMQEPHPPPLIEEQSPSETKPRAEQVEHGEQFEALEAANVALIEDTKDEREEGREVDDSSSLVERCGEIIVGSGVPVEASEKEDGLIGRFEDSFAEEIDCGGQASMFVEEDEKLYGGGEARMAMKEDDAFYAVEDIAKVGEAEEVDGSELNGNCSLTVALSTGGKVVKDSGIELEEVIDDTEVEEKKEIRPDAEEKELEHDKVDGGKEGHEVGDSSFPVDGSGDMIVGAEGLVAKDEPKLKNVAQREKTGLPLTVAEKEDVLIAGVDQITVVRKDGGSEEGKLDKYRETRTDMKQDDESIDGIEIAIVDDKMSGEKKMEGEDCTHLNADALFPVIVKDGGTEEDGKTMGLGTEIKKVKDSGIELKGETNEVEEGAKMQVERDIEMEEKQEEEKEDKEMDSGVEKETKDEEMEVAGKEEKLMEVEDREEASMSGKRKRGRNSRSVVRAPPRKMVGEDVCFICLDGGDLVLCDRRGCPKAYHPSCVDRDEAFFRSKGRWDCGWHLCRQCKKNAHYMCYTCQCSLCKGCLKEDGIFFCVRGSKGLCQTCMKSVMLLEDSEGNDGMVSFDDKSSMDYLFKDYWIEQKETLSLTSDEIAPVINRYKKTITDQNQEMPIEAHAGNAEGGVVSDCSLGTAEATNSERKKSKKQMKSSTEEVDCDAAGKAEAIGTKKRGRRTLKSQSEGIDPNLDDSSKDHLGVVSRRKKVKKLSEANAIEVDSASPSHSSSQWASKEILEFVAHVKNGDTSALSQFDVQELLLEYVKRNKLRDPRRTSQIVCDAMLQKLFGKPRVGHIEMLKLLESHFSLKEDSQGDDNQGSVLDAEVSHLGTDENTDSFVDSGRARGSRARKKGRGMQSNLDDYAAIDTHNIKLIYLRRNLIEALLEDRESFHEKVVGSFVRIRITGSSQKQEIHRLVQVIGTPKAAEPYRVGKRISYYMLEISNLNKTEIISIDAISNLDFDEDECKRLRQSIKCGFLSRLTVGDVLGKAKDLQVVRATDWLETEITRLNHLRDRASDLGRKKQLRECVEKLALLNTPEERQRRLDEIHEVHDDPNMDPSYESEDERESEKGRESDIWRRETWREREHFPSRKEDSHSTDPWNSTANSPTKKWEQNRSLSARGFSSRPVDAVVREEPLSGKPRSPIIHSTSLEKLRTPPDSLSASQSQLSELGTRSSTCAPLEASQPPSTLPVQNEIKVGESEKLWHYKDPTGKIQGPFSITQLRKWNKNGYFPANLRIWRTTLSENDSILLAEALEGRFEKEPFQAVAKPSETPSQQPQRDQVINTLKVDPNKGAGITRNTTNLLPITPRSQSDPRLSSTNLPHTPTSSQSVVPSPASSGRTRVSRWSGSPTPVQLPTTPGGGGPLQSAADSATVQSTTAQSPVVSAHGWGSGVHVNSTNAMETQGQQPAYSRWPNIPPVNNLPPPPPYSVGQTSSGSFPAQNPSVLSSQASWTSQTPAVQQNIQTATFPAQNHSVLPSQASWTSQVPAAQQNVQTTSSGTFPAQDHSVFQSQASWTAQVPAAQQNAQTTSSGTFPAQDHSVFPSQASWTSQVPAAQQNVQTTSSGTFPAQNQSVLPSQASWTPQVPAAQQNMQPVGTVAQHNQVLGTTQFPGNAANWAQMQAYVNMGWAAPNGPFPVGQFGSQPGATVGAAMMQASGQAFGQQPGNMNPGWVASTTNPGAAGPWNWQPPQGMVAPPGPPTPKGQKPCPYLMQGHCKKGSACDFRHN